MFHGTVFNTSPDLFCGLHQSNYLDLHVPSQGEETLQVWVGKVVLTGWTLATMCTRSLRLRKTQFLRR